MNLKASNLNKTLQPIDVARGLPNEHYVDQSVFDEEKQAVLFDNWVGIGIKADVPNEGDVFPVEFAGMPLLVVRENLNTVKVYQNTCRHRGMILIQEPGNVRGTIRCPYHSWCYGLDGELRSTPHAGGPGHNLDPSIDRETLGLIEIDSYIYREVIFVNISGKAPNFTKYAEKLIERWAEHDQPLFHGGIESAFPFDVACNWKILIDNFLECYHCAPAHKDFVDLVDMDSYRTITHKRYSSQCASAPRTTNSNAYSFNPGEVDFGYAGFFVWPNFTIWIYPGEANLSVLQMNPKSEQRTIEFQDWFTLGGVLTPQLAEAAAYQKDVLQPEDIAICESVQRGLKSKAYNQGRFIVDNGKTELSEHAVHHFQRMVFEALKAKL